MFTLVLNSLLISLLFTPFGFILTNKNKKNLDYYSTQLLYGLIILTFIALFLNFFFPLGKNLNTLLLIIPLIILIKKKEIYFNLQFVIFLLLSTFLISLLILESDVYRPDAGLYHLPYIKILNDEKIIFGLSNLHSRYAHISIMQYLAAISNNLIFGNNGIVFAQALVASAVIINFTYKIYIFNKNKEYSFYFFYLIGSLIFISYKMNRYGEYGNDAPSHFLLFFLISEILSLKEHKAKHICNNFILIAFIIFNKITLLMCLFLGFISLNKSKIIEIFKLKRFYFLLIFTFLWLIKNIIISGCLLYPVKSLCFENLLWSNLKLVELVSAENESWTKGWPDYVKIQKQNNEKIISNKDYSKNFYWLPYWSNGHLNKIIEILLPYLLFLLLLIIFLKIYSNSKNKISLRKDNLYIIVIMFLASIFWFIKVPVYRYAYSYFISLISLLFAYTCMNFYEFKNNINKFFNYLLIFCILILVTKNILRIQKNDNNYNNYPWPKYFSMTEENILADFKVYKLGDIIILKPLMSGYCMYSKKICSQYPPNELEIKKIYGYNILIK